MTKVIIGRPKLLVVDDEIDIRNVLLELLSEHFEVFLGVDGADAVSLTRKHHPDLILMDVIMPKMGGFEACAEIRKERATRHIPVLMLTALNATYDRTKAFNLGADDFISKPFDLEELIARLNARLRRVKEHLIIPSDSKYFGNLAIDIPNRKITVDETPLELPPVEFELISLLIKKEGQLISRKEIMKTVWGDELKNDRVMDAHLTSLRKRMSKFNGEIQTIYGQGYRLKLN